MKNKYIIDGDVTTIFLNTKKGVLEAKIDTNDLEKVNEFYNTWCANFSPSTKTHYVVGRYNNQRVFLHRFIMEPKPGKVVDHINHDTLDNTRRNMREVTQKQNMRNIAPSKLEKPRGISGHRYVYWKKSISKWVVTRRKNKRVIYAGIYEQLSDAVKASKKIS